MSDKEFREAVMRGDFGHDTKPVRVEIDGGFVFRDGEEKLWTDNEELQGVFLPIQRENGKLVSVGGLEPWMVDDLLDLAADNLHARSRLKQIADAIDRILREGGEG